MKVSQNKEETTRRIVVGVDGSRAADAALRWAVRQAALTGETAEAAIAQGHADAIAFGRIFISNPDLPRRLQHGFPLTPYNRATFYGGEAAGYTDYPVHDQVATA